MNYTHIAITGIASFFLGWAWHSPLLFGKLWMRLSGIEMPTVVTPEMKKAMMRPMIIGFFSNLLVAGVLSYLISLTGATALTNYLCVALLIWLGFIVPTILNEVLWGKRSVKLYLFNITYHLVSVLVMALILGLLA